MRITQDCFWLACSTESGRVSSRVIGSTLSKKRTRRVGTLAAHVNFGKPLGTVSWGSSLWWWSVEIFLNKHSGMFRRICNGVNVNDSGERKPSTIRTPDSCPESGFHPGTEWRFHSSPRRQTCAHGRWPRRGQGLCAEAVACGSECETCGEFARQHIMYSVHYTVDTHHAHHTRYAPQLSLITFIIASEVPPP